MVIPVEIDGDSVGFGRSPVVVRRIVPISPKMIINQSLINHSSESTGAKITVLAFCLLQLHIKPLNITSTVLVMSHSGAGMGGGRG